MTNNITFHYSKKITFDKNYLPYYKNLGNNDKDNSYLLHSINNETFEKIISATVWFIKEKNFDNFLNESKIKVDYELYKSTHTLGFNEFFQFLVTILIKKISIFLFNI